MTRARDMARDAVGGIRTDPRKGDETPLEPAGGVWHGPRRFKGGHTHPSRRCRSSVVEHSLGKGEVDSSILSGSTIKSMT